METRFDLLVVGGGIYGAALVREAATRGLRAALIEQNDFCSGTSANSLKIMHGGLRYLQQADLPRVFESIRERSIWLRTAPHLVEPLNCIMPTCASLLRNRGVMSFGLWINDILSAGRNRGLARSRQIGDARTVGRNACRDALPALPAEAVTGGAVWHDAIGYDPERLVISMLLDADDAGASVANYVRASALAVEDEAVKAVQAEDRLTGERFAIRSEVVINATGAWAPEFLEACDVSLSVPCRHLALGVNFILKRGPSGDVAAGLTSGPGTPSGGRLFFFVPWRGVVMAGTYYRPHEGPVDTAAVTQADIDAYLAALNSCYPGMELAQDDILQVHAGVLPAARAARHGEEPPLLRHYRLIDHGNRDGVDGLFTVLGVKYTTARGVAEHAITVAESRLSCPRVRSSTARRPLAGGGMGDPEAFHDATIEKYGDKVPRQAVERLLRYYGTGVDAILASVDCVEWVAGGDAVLVQEIRHIVDNEMPQTLGDLLFRRSGLASVQRATAELVEGCGRIMAEQRGWDDARGITAPFSCMWITGDASR